MLSQLVEKIVLFGFVSCLASLVDFSKDYFHLRNSFPSDSVPEIDQGTGIGGKFHSYGRRHFLFFIFSQKDNHF